MKGRSPNAEERKWMDAIAEFGCVVCHRTMEVASPPEIHHIHGKTEKDCHLNTIPLCYYHHRAGTDDLVATSRHPHK